MFVNGLKSAVYLLPVAAGFTSTFTVNNTIVSEQGSCYDYAGEKRLGCALGFLLEWV